MVKQLLYNPSVWCPLASRGKLSKSPYPTHKHMTHFMLYCKTTDTSAFINTTELTDTDESQWWVKLSVCMYYRGVCSTDIVGIASSQKFRFYRDNLGEIYPWYEALDALRCIVEQTFFLHWASQQSGILFPWIWLANRAPPSRPDSHLDPEHWPLRNF